jgi:hypothetical protein
MHAQSSRSIIKRPVSRLRQSQMAGERCNFLCTSSAAISETGQEGRSELKKQMKIKHFMLIFSAGRHYCVSCLNFARC